MLTYSVLAEKNIPVELKFWKTLFSEKPNFKKHDLYFCLPVTLLTSHTLLPSKIFCENTPKKMADLLSGTYYQVMQYQIYCNYIITI